VAQLLVSGMGWRNAYLLLGGVLAVLVPLAAFLPQREREPTTAPGTLVAPRDWTLAEAAGTWQFWVLSLVYMLTSIGSFLVSLHQMAFATEVGFDPLYAATALGLGALLALPGVIVTGTLSDHIGREPAEVVSKRGHGALLSAKALAVVDRGADGPESCAYGRMARQSG
jgi:MFS family permease